MANVNPVAYVDCECTGRLLDFTDIMTEIVVAIIPKP